MESQSVIIEKSSGLIFISLETALSETLWEVDNFKQEYNISTKNFKYVEDKLFLHNIFNNIIKLLKENKDIDRYKPVLFIPELVFNQKQIKTPVILKQLRTLKKLLPIPLIIPLADNIFLNRDGKLKEINNKCLYFYTQRKIKLKELKRYLKDKGYTSLLETLSSIINLKGFYY